MLSEHLREQLQAISQNDAHLGRLLEAIVSHIDKQDQAIATLSAAQKEPVKERKHGN